MCCPDGYGDAAAWLAISQPQWVSDDGQVMSHPAEQCDMCGHSTPCPLDHT